MTQKTRRFVCLFFLTPAIFALLSCSSKEEDPLMKITITPVMPYLIMGKSYSCDALKNAMEDGTGSIEPDIQGPYARYNVTIKNISKKTLIFQLAKAKFKSTALSGDLIFDISSDVSTQTGQLNDTYEADEEKKYSGGAYKNGDDEPTGCWPLITGFNFVNSKKQTEISGKWRFYFTVTKNEKGETVEEPYSADAESSVNYLGDDF